jgi:hypothetical protein
MKTIRRERGREGERERGRREGGRMYIQLLWSDDGKENTM